MGFSGNTDYHLTFKTTGHIISAMNASTDKKQHLLESGMAVIFRQGYNGTGVQDIVDAAGVPKGSFYNYFDSKEAFAVEGLTRLAEQSQVCARAVLGDAQVAPLTRVVNYFEGSLKYQTENGFSGGCIIGNLCQEMADGSESMRERINELMCAKVKMIAQCLAEAQARGEFPADRDASDSAEFIFYAWEGALMRMKACKNDEPLQAFMRVLKAVCLFH